VVPQCSGYVSFMFSEKKAWMKRERPGLFSDALADSRKQHTVNNDIANRIHPILPVLRFSFICLELPSKVPQDRITLRQDPAIQLNDWDDACRVHLRHTSLLLFRVLLEAIAGIIIGYTSIFP